MGSPEYEKVNYHTHCYRCRHGHGAVMEYAEEAIRKGVTTLGFTDHMPFPDDRYGGRRMPYIEIEDYLDEVALLKDRLEGKIRILRGFEGEYVRSQGKFYEWLLNHDKCDYLILGQHFVEVEDEHFISAYNLTDTEQYEIYAKNVVESMQSGYFRYLAHPDLFFVNDHPWDTHCDRACDIIIDGAIKYGFALEYNANGPRQGKRFYKDAGGQRDMYPYPKFWDKVEGTGICVFVGSDCHEPESVYDAYVELAYERLKNKEISICTDLGI